MYAVGDMHHESKEDEENELGHGFVVDGGDCWSV
jgi:hypothetical protein